MWPVRRRLEIDTDVVSYASGKRMMIVRMKGNAAVEEGRRIEETLSRCDAAIHPDATLLDLSKVTVLSDSALGYLLGSVARCSVSRGVGVALVARSTVFRFIRIAAPWQDSERSFFRLFDNRSDAERYLRTDVLPRPGPS